MNINNMLGAELFFATFALMLVVKEIVPKYPAIENRKQKIQISWPTKGVLHCFVTQASYIDGTGEHSLIEQGGGYLGRYNEGKCTYSQTVKNVITKEGGLEIKVVIPFISFDDENCVDKIEFSYGTNMNPKIENKDCANPFIAVFK